MTPDSLQNALGCLDRVLRAIDPGSAIDEIAAAAREILGPGEMRIEWGRLRMGAGADPKEGPWDVEVSLSLPGAPGSGRMLWRRGAGARPESPDPDQMAISVLSSVAAAALARLLPDIVEPGSGEQGLAELGRMRQRLGRAEQLALLGRLTADVAHEMNNPLTAILGFAQLLSDDTTGVEAASEHLSGLREQTLRCRRIARTLAAFSGRTEINLRPVDLDALMTEVTLAVAARERAAGLPVVPIPAQRECWVEADRDLLTEAVMNLVEGSVEERKLHGPGGRVEVRCRRDGEEVILEIQDDLTSGAGSERPSEAASVLLRITTGIVTMHRGHLERRPAAGVRIRARFPGCEGLPSLRRNELYRQWETSGP